MFTTPSIPLPKARSIWIPKDTFSSGTTPHVQANPPNAEVLDSFARWPWGEFVLFRFLDDPHPIHCARVELFLTLFTESPESLICQPPPVENSSSKISWRKRLSSFIARQKS